MWLNCSRRLRLPIPIILILCLLCFGFGLLTLCFSSDDPISSNIHNRIGFRSAFPKPSTTRLSGSRKSCATVEEMGQIFEGGFSKESLRVRNLIKDHFDLNGAARVRGLPPEEFCRHSFVVGKASEAGFGNEMYKLLTAAALSIMLNRSLIIGQTRHIGEPTIIPAGGKYPFGEYISYSNVSFTLKEVKLLWRQNDCETKYGRVLVARVDNFQKPEETNVLCGNWMEWEQPVIWFDGAMDAVAVQFFLKNIHPEIRKAASNLFGEPENLHARPNVFGEIMRILISPSENVEEAVNWVLGGMKPDIALHMRMLTSRSLRAMQAALNCIRKAVQHMQVGSRPKVVLISDTPSLINDITPVLNEFAEVIHFDYNLFRGKLASLDVNNAQILDFRIKDWGPAPRWVAFVDFFLASQAKHAVVSGAHRRIATTYVQLLAALAAANELGENSGASGFAFFSSFQHSLLADGLQSQLGWGHAWNRFAGALSCRNQSNQCAFTPLLPLAWWDGLWQSPSPRDIRRLSLYGIHLTGFGTFDEHNLTLFCNTRKNAVKTVQVSSL
ncbi:hypothetical protein RJ641_022542 [Dillenia turbinata]|uniref:Uncharacterized protein n=1 Tax=Dillenia turbinata TaxID=194707 RepID=A0AAN8UKN3_9MAGN